VDASSIIRAQRACRACGKTYPISWFYPYSRTRWHLDCKDCENARSREKYRNDPERKLAQTRAYAKNHPEQGRLRHARHRKTEAYRAWVVRSTASGKIHGWHTKSRLKRKYGITQDQVDILLASQGGVCAICLNPPNKQLYVDHDHLTGRVRGLLCHRCNLALGMLGDNESGIRRALNYLRGVEIARLGTNPQTVGFPLL
jgi:hypothetical protein